MESLGERSHVHISRRRVLGASPALVPAVPLGAVLAACAGPGTGAGKIAPSAKPVKLELATDWSTPTRQEVMDLMKAEFTAKYPNVTIQHQYIGGAGGSAEGYSERTVAQLVAGTAPDVIANWAYQPHVDQVADVTRDAPAAGWKKADMFYDPFNQEIDGKLYMFSMSASVSGWAYNKNLFQAASLKEPDDSWTMDDVLEAARRLTRPDRGVFGALAVNAVWFGWLEHVWAGGAGATSATTAEMFSVARKKSRLGEAGGPEAFERYVDLIHRHKVAPTADEQRDKAINFVAGNVGMFPLSIYSSGARAQQIGSNFVWSAMPIPRDPITKKRAYDVNSEGMVIPKVTKTRGTYETALAYTLTFYSDPVMRAVARQRSTLPVVRKWIDSRDYLDPPPLNLDVIVNTINDKQNIVGDHGGRFRQFPQWIAAVRAELNKAFSGESTPRPAMAAAMAAGDQILAAQ